MKYVALDIGNVLCHVNSDGFIDFLSETLNITQKDANRFLKRFQQIHDLGYTTMEDELKDKFNVKSEVILKKIAQAWNDSVSPNIVMLEKLNEIRKIHGLKVALLSNIGVEHSASMESKLETGGFFQSAIKHFSCFVGARKPSMIYYQSFLSQHPEFYGCLYVDDLVENLEASKQFGFQTFHLSLEDTSNFNQKITDIEKLLKE